MPEKGSITLEALLCTICFFAFALAATLTLWHGLRFRLEEHRHFTLHRERFRLSPSFPDSPPAFGLRPTDRQP
jgi:hypothetical protein